MKTFDFFFGASLGELLLRHSDNLSKTLQSSTMSAAEGQEIASMTVATLKSIRTDEMFQLFWEKTTRQADHLGVKEPELPRRRKRPRRYEDDGASSGDFQETVEGLYRCIYYEALDLVICGIEARFNQPGYKVYSNLETLLMKAAKCEEYDEAFEFIIEFYKDDFDRDQLALQLEIFSTNIPIESAENLNSVISYLQQLSAAQKSLLSEVCKLAHLILIMPATNAVSERTFSSLRRLKTYLRSTMKNERLNHLMVLYVYKTYTDALHPKTVATEFVNWSSHRQSVFGTFLPTD
jgi:hypothetical protein